MHKNEPEFHRKIILSDEAYFHLGDYVNKQNCRIRARGRSLEELMIFHTYNRSRISDSSKDFSESYGESA